jgi:hypothetical protein
VQQVSTVPLALPAAEGQGAVMVGGIPSAVGLMPVFRPESYGAVRDGTTDDSAAIQAAEDARNVAGGILFFSPGVYAIASPLNVHDLGHGVNWTGAAGLFESTTIKATSPMKYMLGVASGGCRFEHLTFDCSNNARDGIVRFGDALTIYEHMLVTGAIRDGYHSASITVGTPGGLTITQTGPGPSMTVSVPDASELLLVPGQPVVLTIVTGGAIGTATFSTSINGGAGGPEQIIYTSSLIGVPDSPTHYSYGSGVALNPTAGTYVSGTTYAFTPTNAGSAGVINDASTFLECSATVCGFQYKSAGFPPEFSRPITQPGTVAVTMGSQIVTGTGTTFTATTAHLGDSMYVVNGTPILYKIACVLDDTHIALAPFLTPAASISGQDYAICTGAGYSENLGQDQNINKIIGGFWRECSTGMTFAGGAGPTVIGSQIDVIQVDAIYDRSFDGGTFIRVYTEGGGPYAYSFSLSNGAGSAFIRKCFSQAGGGQLAPNGAAAFYDNAFGQYSAGGSQESVRKGAINIIETPGTVSGASYQFPSPSNDPGSNNTSYQVVNNGAAVTLTSTPTITAGLDGNILVIFNLGKPITFVDNSQHTGTLLQLQAPMVTVGSGDTIRFLQSNSGSWRQLGQVSHQVSYSSIGGGEGSAIVRTTDATPTTLMSYAPGNTGNSVGGYKAVVTACVDGFQTAHDSAAWFDVNVSWHSHYSDNPIVNWSIGDVHGTNGGGSGVITSGGAPFGWDITVTYSGGPSGTLALVVTGDASHTVNWSVRYILIGGNQPV